MRSSVLLLSLFLPFAFLTAQDLGDRRIVLEEVTIPNMPGVHSFACGQQGTEWLLLGGRTDGLHQRQPFAAFQAAANNTMAHVVDPYTGEVWSRSISSLPAAIYEQLQSTNLESHQRGNTLYIIGGYGYSATAGDHITHSKLTAVDVPGAIAAIKNGSALGPHFRQLSDSRMAVAGGYVGFLNDEFYLVGGQRFMGRYNPMGPNFGPGFIQEYTNAIRRFRIEDDGTSFAIAGFTETVDTAELHRRDFNLIPQIFPNGEQGFTAFSGVFQYTSDIPWLNTVDITPSGYTVVPVFEQLLNQYHTAHLPAYSTSSNKMSTVFFGGIGRYYYDANGQLWDDVNVPFVNTISRVVRSANGNMVETAIGSMPALLGSGAEFITAPGVPTSSSDIIDLDQLEGDTVLAGHIVGGIKSSAANIFFTNNGTQSEASTRVFKVLLVRDINTGIANPTTPSQTLQLAMSDSGEQLIISLDIAKGLEGTLNLLDSSGRLVRTIVKARMPAGSQKLHYDVRDLSKGSYLVEWTTPQGRNVARFVR